MITIRGGTTVEVVNTDAEGRLVMADALVLAARPRPDAIVDIATLTGAMMRALGREVAGVIGNHDGLVDQVRAAAERPPPSRSGRCRSSARYRAQLDSTVADMKNLGWGTGRHHRGAVPGATSWADVPWAHLDIAGTA